ncbi:hypothetical protein FJT64_023487 [Amphibalanus amphitrite]|uniref:PH domain-containing protein n=1 Tax=Amphibalanus amphitrite TaxID=1232801 RepID=A0A6A4WAF1_AMPAM|nr:hypothetical protein FJT64_023487 [Amphibalanus amphitrite]
MLTSDPHQPVSLSERRWVHADEVAMRRGRQWRPCYLVLLSDLVLIAQRNRQVVFVTEPPLMLVDVIQHTFNVKKKETEFQLTVPAAGGGHRKPRCLAFRAPNLEAKLAWEDQVHKQMSLMRASQSSGSLASQRSVSCDALIETYKFEDLKPAEPHGAERGRRRSSSPPTSDRRLSTSSGSHVLPAPVKRQRPDTLRARLFGAPARPRPLNVKKLSASAKCCQYLSSLNVPAGERGRVTPVFEREGDMTIADFVKKRQKVLFDVQSADSADGAFETFLLDDELSSNSVTPPPPGSRHVSYGCVNVVRYRGAPPPPRRCRPQYNPYLDDRIEQDYPELPTARDGADDDRWTAETTILEPTVLRDDLTELEDSAYLSRSDELLERHSQKVLSTALSSSLSSLARRAGSIPSSLDRSEVRADPADPPLACRSEEVLPAFRCDDVDEQGASTTGVTGALLTRHGTSCDLVTDVSHGYVPCARRGATKALQRPYGQLVARQVAAFERQAGAAAPAAPVPRATSLGALWQVPPERGSADLSPATPSSRGSYLTSGSPATSASACDLDSTGEDATLAPSSGDSQNSLFGGLPDLEDEVAPDLTLELADGYRTQTDRLMPLSDIEEITEELDGFVSGSDILSPISEEASSSSAPQEPSPPERDSFLRPVPRKRQTQIKCDVNQQQDHQASEHMRNKVRMWANGIDVIPYSGPKTSRRHGEDGCYRTTEGVVANTGQPSVERALEVITDSFRGIGSEDQPDEEEADAAEIQVPDDLESPEDQTHESPVREEAPSHRTDKSGPAESPRLVASIRSLLRHLSPVTERRRQEGDHRDTHDGHQAPTRAKRFPKFWSHHSRRDRKSEPISTHDSAHHGSHVSRSGKLTILTRQRPFTMATVSQMAAPEGHAAGRIAVLPSGAL